MFRYGLLIPQKNKKPAAVVQKASIFGDESDEEVGFSSRFEYSGYSLIRNHVCGGYSFLITEFPHKRTDVKRKLILFAVPTRSL